MRIITALLMVALFAVPAVGQQITAEQAAKYSSGTRKLWLGAGLIAAGVIVLPVTAIEDDSPHGSRALTGVGLVGLGVGAIWWGVRQRKDSARPYVTIGVRVGQSRSIHFQRSW